MSSKYFTDHMSFVCRSFEFHVVKINELNYKYCRARKGSMPRLLQSIAYVMRRISENNRDIEWTTGSLNGERKRKSWSDRINAGRALLIYLERYSTNSVHLKKIASATAYRYQCYVSKISACEREKSMHDMLSIPANLVDVSVSLSFNKRKKTSLF